MKVASFEVGLAIDTASINTEYPLDFDWKNELVEGFQRDVLAVNYSDIEAANKIVDQYDEETRRKIFSPFMRIIANEKIKMTVTSYDHEFRRDYSTNRIKKEFRRIVVPRFEEEDELIEKKFKIHHLVIALEEGREIKDIKNIKEITQGLLFGEEQSDADYIIHSPILFNNKSYHLINEIICTLTIAPNGNFQIYQSGLDLIAESRNIEDVKTKFNTILAELIEEYFEIRRLNKFKDYPQYLELEKYLDLEGLFD